MTVDQAIEWALRIVMACIAVFTVLWGRSQKQADDRLDAKTQALDQRIRHGLRSAEALVESKITSLDQKSRALERLFESQLALRDQSIAALVKQLDVAAGRTSDAATKVMGKMGELEHRLTILETRIRP